MTAERRYLPSADHLPLPRSPRGHPFLTHAGSAQRDIALGARYADGVFTPVSDIAAEQCVSSALTCLYEGSEQ